MGVFFAILVIYGLYQLNRGGNKTMFNKALVTSIKPLLKTSNLRSAFFGIYF